MNERLYGSRRTILELGSSSPTDGLVTVVLAAARGVNVGQPVDLYNPVTAVRRVAVLDHVDAAGAHFRLTD